MSDLRSRPRACVEADVQKARAEVRQVAASARGAAAHAGAAPSARVRARNVRSSFIGASDTAFEPKNGCWTNPQAVQNKDAIAIRIERCPDHRQRSDDIARVAKATGVVLI